MTHTEYQEAKRHFRAPSPSETLRQKIWAELRKNVATKHTIKALAKAVGGEVKHVYRACKALCRKGYALRTFVLLPAPTKKDPEHKKKITAVQGVDPWTSTEKGW